jgi:hypothetical protein
MVYKWYYPVWNGMLSPVIFLVAGAVVGVLWQVRVLSNRGWALAAWLLVTSYVAHMDYMFTVSGFQGVFLPDNDWITWLARVPIYAAVAAFLTWGAWGWLKLRVGQAAVDLPRGLPYLKERWRERKEKRG